MPDFLILSKKWSSGRSRRTSVERFCELLDPEFPGYHGSRFRVPPAISRFFKHHTNSIRSASYSAPYNSFSFELELWGLLQVFSRKFRFLFFPYADYDYFYWQFFRKILRKKVILWSFFSEKELKERYRDLSHFAHADLVLVAGQAQLAYLQARSPQKNLRYFPIGVDTDFFTPETVYDPLRLVHVGNNRRDFNTLIQGLDLVFARYPGLKVDLVGASASRDKIPARSYLVWHDHLDDARYLSVLQNANFALLSLADGGSSNSLLELYSCGLPVIATAMPNTTDYLDPSASLLFAQGDFAALAEHCCQLLENARFRADLSQAARNHSLKFNWQLLRKQFIDLVESL